MFNPARLEALRESGLLDTQEDFAYLTYKTAKSLNAEICQINALQDKIQKTIAVFPFKEYAMLPVEDSGCIIPVRQKKSFAVDDSGKHPRTCTQAWTKEYPGYLGAPIIYNGHALGAICVLTTVPRKWTAEDIKKIEEAAAEVAAKLVARQIKSP